MFVARVCSEKFEKINNYLDEGVVPSCRSKVSSLCDRFIDYSSYYMPRALTSFVCVLDEVTKTGAKAKIGKSCYFFNYPRKAFSGMCQQFHPHIEKTRELLTFTDKMSDEIQGWSTEGLIKKINYYVPSLIGNKNRFNFLKKITLSIIDLAVKIMDFAFCFFTLGSKYKPFKYFQAVISRAKEEIESDLKDVAIKTLKETERKNYKKVISLVVNKLVDSSPSVKKISIAALLAASAYGLYHLDLIPGSIVSSARTCSLLFASYKALNSSPLIKSLAISYRLSSFGIIPASISSYAVTSSLLFAGFQSVKFHGLYDSNYIEKKLTTFEYLSQMGCKNYKTLISFASNLLSKSNK